jgi:DNA-directed RNA polymerase
MVVGPKELEKMTEDEKRALKILEEKIDIELFKDSYNENRYTVTIDGIKATRKVQKKIKEIYQNAGWRKVTFNSEQRGGDWIEFLK